MRAAPRSTLRARVHLSHTELVELKSAIVMSMGDVGAALTISEAISAALFIALADRWPNFTPGQPATLAMMVSAEGKGLFAGSGSMAGQLSMPLLLKIGRAPEAMSMAEAAVGFRTLGDGWRNAATAAAKVEQFIGWFRFTEEGGCPAVSGQYAPDLEPKSAFVVDNQTALPMGRIRFGHGSLIGYMPWGSYAGAVHLVAAPEPRETRPPPQASEFTSRAPSPDTPISSTSTLLRRVTSGVGSVLGSVPRALDLGLSSPDSLLRAGVSSSSLLGGSFSGSASRGLDESSKGANHAALDADAPPAVAKSAAKAKLPGRILSRESFATALRANEVQASPSEIDEIFAVLKREDSSGEIDGSEFESAFCAARLAGGIDVYVPVATGGPRQLTREDLPAEMAYLESAKFKQKLLFGWTPKGREFML